MQIQSKQASQLRSLVDQLNAFIEDGSAENSVVPGNGYDESMLVGSADSYLRLARVLIEVVSLAGNRSAWADSDLEEETIEGVTVVSTNLIKEAFHEFSPVWPLCGYLAADDASAKLLARKLAQAVGLRVP